MMYVRDGAVFNLSRAPASDLASPLRSTVTRHHTIPSVGDFPRRTVGNVFISAGDVGHFRSLYVGIRWSCDVM
jgi:hypothetical protein